MLRGELQVHVAKDNGILRDGMFSFEGCHPAHIPLLSFLILQINVCSTEETVSFKVKGLFSVAVQRTAATY